LLAGCGFHLRGSQGIDASVGRLNVSAVNAYGPFVRTLERSLVQSGVKVEKQGGGAPYSVRVLDERTSRRSVATTDRITVSDYELRMEVDFELVDDKGKTLIQPTSLVAERIYSFDSTNLTGSDQEEDLLKDEMRRELAEQMKRRIDATVRSMKAREQL
jgi:LPS-assembly lipoprotein